MKNASLYIPINAHGRTTAVLINSDQRKRAESHMLNFFWIAPQPALEQENVRLNSGVYVCACVCVCVAQKGKSRLAFPTTNFGPSFQR